MKKKMILLGVLVILVLMCSFSQAALVHRWSFNGDPNDSTGSADATLHGHAVIADNTLDLTDNNEFQGYIEGSNDAYASLPINSTLAGLTDTVTIEAWVYWVASGAVPNIDKYARVWDFGSDSSHAIPFVPNQDQQTMSQIRENPTNNSVTTSMLSKNVWYHVVVTIDKGEEIKLYIDGAWVDLDTCSLAPSDITITNCFLGRYCLTSATSVRMWDGKIDELRIYDEVISGEQILGNYQCGPDDMSCGPVYPPSAVLLHHWSFDEDANDIVGGAGATLYGNAVIADNVLDLTANDESLGYVSGTNDAYASLPINSTLAGLTETASIAAWVCWASDADLSNKYARVWDFGSDSSHTIQLNTNQDQYTMTNIREGSSGDHRGWAPMLSKNVWHHVAITINKTGNTFKFYVDGVLADDPAACSLAPSDVTITNCLLGRYCDTTSTSAKMWDGKIDEISIYEGILSAEDVWLLSLPYTAWDPSPTDEAVSVATDATLSWESGRDAIEHDVYFGIDFDDVNNANTSTPDIYRGRQAANSYDPALEFDTTYYWRIDEVNDTNVWKGDVWEFTVAVGLIGHWKFDGDATDSAGIADATLYGNAVIADNVLDLTANDESLGYVDGTNDAYASLPIQSILAGLTDTMSIVGWVCWTTDAPTNSYYARVWDFGSDSTHNIALVPNQDGGTIANIRQSTDNRVTTSMLSKNVWHHVAFTIDKGAEVKLYVDGILAGSAACTLAPSDITITNCLLGRYCDTSYTGVMMWDGQIDDLRIYDIVLSATEIGDLFSPYLAWDPSPADEVGDVATDATLSWRSSGYAAQHNVYFGTKLFGDVDGDGYVDLLDVDVLAEQWLTDGGSQPSADIDGDDFVNYVDFAIVAGDWMKDVFIGNQEPCSYDPGGLEFGTTYYWWIDEVNDPCVWKGDVWSFTTSWITAWEGWNIYDPPASPDYRYGPSIIINDDDSIDMWCSSPGGGGEWDWIRHRKSIDGGHTWGTETIVLRPTPGSLDYLSVCDPGVIKFGGYYYIGYSSTHTTGSENETFVARSTSPTGPFDKWNGNGWGGNPQPFIPFTGSPDSGGSMEPSFVVKDGTLYIYYTCHDVGPETRVATASASDLNWPGNITYHGTALIRFSGEDSADVKYIPAKEKFISVGVGSRFGENSYIHVWESTDGLTFVPADEVRDNVQLCAHNMGISGTAEGHIDLNDNNFIAYAYEEDCIDSWAYWPTWLNPITFE